VRDLAVLVQADPDAYMRECARLFPPVNGMNPWRVTFEHTFIGKCTNS
jgi:hypothetical protein